MLSDFYGNKLTTTTGLARDNYDVGLKAFLSANYGAEEAFSLSVEADPNFSLACVSLMPSTSKTVFCISRLSIRMAPPPISVPLITIS